MLTKIAKHSEKLLYFYEVANEGSLQALARKLGMSAPSLSHSIKQLEAVVGRPLFQRSRTGMKLTDAGDKLFVFCRRYFREMEEVQRSIDHSEQQFQRKIKVGTFQSIAIYFWPLLYNALKNDNRVSLSISTDRSRAILEALVKREVDVALTVGTLKHEKLVKQELYKDEYSFYYKNRSGRAEIKRNELKNLPILYIPDALDENGKSLRQYIESWNLVFSDEFEVDSLEVIAEFTKKEYGVGLLPTKVAKTYGDALRPVRIEGVPAAKFGTHRFFLSYRDDLDMPQQLMSHLLVAARAAVVQLNS